MAITSPVAFDKTNQNMYWLWGEQSDLGSLVMFPFDAVDQKEVLYTATRAQIGTIMIHPTDKTLLAVTEVYHKPELFVANDTVMDDLQYLAEFLFNTQPELEQYKLNRQVGFDFKARDDMVIQAYLSLPPEAALRNPSDVPAADRGYAELGMLPVEPQKLVVLVHGGPKARDHYGFSSLNVFLTNRGYAVLQVNFRGSTGFGKRLTNAGDGEWGRKMHFDILDSVEFAVAKGITNRSQVAIMGGSYGGYETLAALTFTPDEFACGVDIVGPSNLVSLLEAVPPYWRGFYKDLVRMVGGDIDSEAGRHSLTARSPLFFADRVKKPLMILQGANDPRVKQQESDQFVAALKKNHIPVTYVLYPDEGHGFRKANNRLAQCGFIEKFLHMCLGGRYEPFQQGQHNSSAILMSDGFTAAPPAPSTIPPLPMIPSLAPQLFYRPIIPRPVVRPTMYLPPTANVLTRIFPQYHG
ncbi:peptidase, S9A/B/C family, catalytic domain protein [Teladorsagia circumcincta]|uniref:Prolyl endopeptidase n=1 Tax=Teladorsagia circumcincta TaxID=45464 RepID=A0A2G9UAY2_TELCI|nr:peptidase, S9A/B/C family, catalytic domain protein [Teladorsagia circumcincta]